MSDQVLKNDLLLLPIPAHLEQPSDIPLFDNGCINELTHYLSNRLNDTEAIKNWVEQQFPTVSKLPKLTESDQLLSMERIYDQYFSVGRHEGSTNSMVFAVGQVLAGLAEELQMGTALAEENITVLFDGLTAILEMVDAN